MHRNLMRDVPASIVVFLVALPLSLGIAQASGAPMKAGLIAAVIGGIVVGLLGGAPLQVSGPAAGLTVMVVAFVERFGFETTCIITVFAGLCQMLMGVTGAAQLTMLISPAVIHAMLAGIGILISLGQAHVLLGQSPRSGAIANISNLPLSFLHRNDSALLLGLSTIATIFLWNRYMAKRLPKLPGSLVAVTAGTGASLLLAMDVPRVSISAKIFELSHLPSLASLDLATLAIAGASLALVASAESLLCAVATDKLHSGPRANLKRELVAQGVGNLASGLIGGLPITGVIVRSSANVAAGAASRTSAILHGVWVFLFAAFLSAFLQLIPLAVLAGLLIHVGISLVKIAEIKKVATFGESLIYFATLAGVVFINLLWGIGIGFAVSTATLLVRMNTVKISVKDLSPGNRTITLSGALSFLSVPKLSGLLRQIPAGQRLQMQFNIEYLDHAAIEALRSWKMGYEKQGGSIVKESLDSLWTDTMNPKKGA